MEYGVCSWMASLVNAAMFASIVKCPRSWIKHNAFSNAHCLQDGKSQILRATFVEVTVEDDGHLDFSSLDVTKHCGLLLDGVGDVLLLKRNRETLQGRPKELRGCRSQTMHFAYPFTLAWRAVVVTMDLSAANLHVPSSDRWLSDARNVKVLHLCEQA